MDKIAIVVPVHNRKKTTLNCLRQLQHIKTDGFLVDIVVVDDGSTDGTSEAIARYYPDTTIIKGNGNLWWAGGVNAGLAYTLRKKHDFVYIINDDIEFSPDALLVLYKTLKKHRNAVCSSVFIDRLHKDLILYAGYNFTGLFKKLRSPYKGHRFDLYKGKILSVDCLSTKSVLIPRDIIETAGFLDSLHFPHGISDYDYLMRIKSLGYSLLVNMDSRIYSGESESNIHHLILNKSIPELIDTLRSAKWRTSLKSSQNLFTRSSGIVWGYFRFIYNLIPYAFWIVLRFVLPKPLLKKILVRTGRIRKGYIDRRKVSEEKENSLDKGIKELKKMIRKFVAFLFRIAGMPLLIREVLCRNKVTILVYHDPTPEIFEKHMEYLSKHYSFMPLNTLVAALQSKDWSTVPAKGLVIVFDDGRKGNFHLLEIFKKLKIYPSIYLCSDVVNTHRKFWFESGFRNHHGLKKYTNKERLNKLKNAVGYEPHKEYSERQSLNRQEIEAMAPFVDFQSHSRFHPILTNCTDEECREEIEGSKSSLEEMLGKSIEHFCYPNGDFSDREVEFVKRAGYKSSRSIDIGWNDVNSDRFKLKAIYVDDDASLSVLIAQSVGFFGYLRYMRFGSFNGKHPRYI